MRNIRDVWRDNEDLIKQNLILLEDRSVQALFDGYYYNADNYVSSQMNYTEKARNIEHPSQLTDNSTKFR